MSAIHIFAVSIDILRAVKAKIRKKESSNFSMFSFVIIVIWLSFRITFYTQTHWRCVDGNFVFLFCRNSNPICRGLAIDFASEFHVGLVFCSSSFISVKFAIISYIICAFQYNWVIYNLVNIIYKINFDALINYFGKCIYLILLNI